MTDNASWESILASIMEEFSCQTGTIHQSNAEKNLNLICQIGVPDSLLDKISHIPFGKGIAGVAAESKQPVELCNLQLDLGNVAKPDARQTGVSGSIALPIFANENDQVIGTLGIGKYAPYEFTSEEKQRLASHARKLAQLFAHKLA